jgi:nucleoside-diphosphate-sugar epimerase
LIDLQARRRLSIVGNGLNKVDFTSVHNLTEALLSSVLADPAALGKAYNISNDTPIPLWDVVNYALRQLRMEQVTRYREYRSTWLKGAVNEGACLLWPGRPRPRWSRQGAHSLNADFTLDVARARHYLDYQPQTSLWTALDEFCAWWQVQ